MRQTTVPTVIDSMYLVALGTYRFLYVLNWINRGVKEGHKDPTSWVWGTIQTALMIDFAWVYYSRQRVKLRRGGVVDSEDLGRGWLIGRFVGRKSVDFDFEEEENACREPENAHSKNGWGRRGISVSADEGVRDAPRRKGPVNGNLDPEAQPLADPAAFEDDSDDGLDAPLAAAGSSAGHESGVSGGDEWNDDMDADAQEHSGLPK
jgi:ER lumen protein retaining receptor